MSELNTDFSVHESWKYDETARDIRVVCFEQSDLDMKDTRIFDSKRFFEETGISVQILDIRAAEIKEITSQHVLNQAVIVINGKTHEFTAELVDRLRQEGLMNPILFFVSQPDKDFSHIYDLGADFEIAPSDPDAVIQAKMIAAKRRYDIQISKEMFEEPLIMPILDAGLNTIRINNRRIVLSAVEFDIVNAIYNGCTSMDEIFMQTLVDGVADVVSWLRVNISRIRFKIEPDPKNPIYLLTVRGLGYKFSSTLYDSTSEDT